MSGALSAPSAACVCGKPMEAESINCSAPHGPPGTYVDGVLQTTSFDRSDLLPHWLPSLVGEERAAKLADWQAYRACADCRHWEVEEPGDAVGVCGAFRFGALTAPADHSCADWDPANG